MVGGIVDDVRHAVRSLRAAPAVTIAVVLTLTLGIGATTAIVSIGNGLALRPLPVKNPQDLVVITSDTALRYGFQAGAGWSYVMWDELSQRAGVFDGAFAWTLQRLDLSEGGEMQPVNGLVASGDFFRSLAVQAATGRMFTPADDVQGGGPEGAVAVISHSLWRRRFGGRDVLGSRLLIEHVPVTIVGVAPEWFRGVDVGQPFEIAIPFGTEALVRGPRSLTSSERSLTLTVMLRLKPGQSSAQATAALRAMQSHIVGPLAPAFLKEPFIVVDASRGISDRSRLRQQYLYPILILSIVSGIVLLIVCLNIATLLLSRASARRPDLSVRLTLGAPRWRLVRQHLVEALTLGSLGTTGGVLFAAWASRALVTQLPFPDGGVEIDLSIDWRLFAFIVGLAMLAVTLFWAAPALYATRVAPIEALRDQGRRTGGRRTGLLSRGLVAAQVALSIVLLAAAGLFVKTMNRLVNVPLGFEPKGMLVVTVNADRSIVQPVDQTQLHQRLLEAVMAVPGVLQAAGSVWTPVGTGGGGLLTDARGRRSDIAQQVAYNFVTPGWFQTYGTPATMGRDFDARDVPGAPRVALVNVALRRSVLPENQPLGATIHAGPCGRAECTVVGVVGDATYGQSLRDPAPPTVYLPLAQSADLAPPDAPFRISVRAAGSAANVMTDLAARLHGVDSGVTFTFRRLEQDLNTSVARERLLATLAGFFGAIALLLCGVGLYGVSSYSATRRRAEIGIRLALGGQPHAVVRAMLRRIGLSVLTGVAVGVVAAVWLAHFIAPLLYGLEPHDPVTLVASTSSLAFVAAVAAWIPAWRATRIDPVQVLREV
ncbi:MAG: ABC transporter permease [Acidobacteria bacterium]|nr:ABC transporter permease [Acidobacteriota bacterium]